MAIRKAIRKGSPVIVGLYSKSGGGKTYSAILLAEGLAGPGGKVGFLDTENMRGSLYADITPKGYDIDDLYPPFTPSRYVEKINEFEKAGYNVLVIDSCSHEWVGQGGCLEMHDKAVGGNYKKNYMAWGKVKPEHQKFINAMLCTKMHIVCCMRAKDKTAINPDKNCSKDDKIMQLGIQPQQHEDFIFEMTVSLHLNNGYPSITKCPAAISGVFESGYQINQRHGETIRQWVDGGESVDHDIEQIKAGLRGAAATGMDALKAEWESLPGATKTAIGVNFLDECKAAATASDNANIGNANNTKADLAEAISSTAPVTHDEMRRAIINADPAALDETLQSTGMSNIPTSHSAVLKVYEALTGGK